MRLILIPKSSLPLQNCDLLNATQTDGRMDILEWIQLRIPKEIIHILFNKTHEFSFTFLLISSQLTDGRKDPLECIHLRISKGIAYLLGYKTNQFN